MKLTRLKRIIQSLNLNREFKDELVDYLKPGEDGKLPGGSSSDAVTRGTYKEIKALADTGKLNIDKLYVITDYDCPISDTNFDCDRNNFSIVLRARTNSTFYEEAKAELNIKKLEGDYKYVVFSWKKKWVYVRYNKRDSIFNDGSIAGKKAYAWVCITEGYPEADFVYFNCFEPDFDDIFYTLTEDIPSNGIIYWGLDDENEDFDDESEGIIEKGIKHFKYEDSNNIFVQNNCKLYKWDLKYDINNNKPWAEKDPYKAKGVITYMKDEFENEAYFDFKNIKRKYGSHLIKNNIIGLSKCVILKSCDELCPVTIEGYNIIVGHNVKNLTLTANKVSTHGGTTFVVDELDGKNYSLVAPSSDYVYTLSIIRYGYRTSTPTIWSI